jgi:anionic cell wall polymer biosynthesis LytR-Cps2A-Psr (LCP) family protein
VGAVKVTLPETTKAFGYTFPAGVNHLDGLTAVYYARQSSLTEKGRVLRQQSLFRVVAYRLANAHLLTNPITMYRIIDGSSSSLTVDAAFTNSDVVKCANQFRPMNSRSGVFLMAPTYTVAGKTYLNSFPG